MKAQLTRKQQLKPIRTFNTRLHDSLTILKYSSNELLESLFTEMRENPLIEITYSNTLPYTEAITYEKGIGKKDLKSHLLFQLHTTSKPYNEIICSYIIESLNEYGFFSETIEEAAKELHVDTKEFETNLKLIQGFDPCGVAHKNQIESIIYQAEKAQIPWAESLLTQYSDALVRGNLNQIAEKLNITVEQLHHILQMIRQKTDPFPCRDYTSSKDITIIPDLSIEKIDQQLLIKPVEWYHIGINDTYLELLKKESSLKKYFDRSKILLANINRRNATLMLVAHEMIQCQKEYFLYNSELLPLCQKDIADKLQMNQATVSRTVMNKYYLFNDNIYPLSELFVSATSFGDSSDAIKKALLEIVESENPFHPFSDEQLANELKKYNLTAARRTIAKYRDDLHIPNIRKRKRLK